MNAAQAQGRIAAFLDLDGTLLPLPSLERRFVAALRHRHAIPAANYIRWFARAVRTAPRGIARMAHENKMYLHHVFAAGSTDTPVYGEPRSVCAAAEQAAAASVSANFSCAARFFPAALDRVAWHVAEGHAIILVTGTLEPLANRVALALTLRLLVRGITASIGVCSTRLEQTQNRWTGRVEGEAMFAEAKARAIGRIAAQIGFDLSRCYAYGDTANDRWMLGAVGRPTAVNPSRELERIAQLRSWPIMHWKEQTIALPKTQCCRNANCSAIPSTKSETLA
jgi:HAD superfamily hydrolase (TIGR01490 family)